MASNSTPKLQLAGLLTAACALLGLLSPTALAGEIAAVPDVLPAGVVATTVVLTGTDTQWTGQTVFTITGGIGARVLSQTVSDRTSATLTVAPGVQAGTALLVIADSSDAFATRVSVVAPVVSSQVVCHGDSLTAGENASQGHGTATGTTYPAVLAAALGPSWTVSNVGTGGWTVDQMAREASAKVDTLFQRDYGANILIVFAGTNNIGGARESAETVFAKLTAYCAARHKARHWKILVVTPPVAAYPKVYPPNFDTEMLRYGAMIRKNWPSFADGLIDTQADSRLGVPGDEFNPVYFNAHDFTHLTDAGYALVGNYAAQAVFAVLAPGSPTKP